MKKDTVRIIYSVLILTGLLAGCGGNPTPAPAASPTPFIEASMPPTVSTTPDPCSPGQVEIEVQKIHRHMREFDDASILASNMPREQLSASVADLQRIRREAEDEQIPACLTNLKIHQVEHMNSVIDTLVAFIGGTDQQTLEQGISIARQQHDEYTLELARILGLTVVPASEATAGTPSETPTP